LKNTGIEGKRGRRRRMQQMTDDIVERENYVRVMRAAQDNTRRQQQNAAVKAC